MKCIITTVLTSLSANSNFVSIQGWFGLIGFSLHYGSCFLASFHAWSFLAGCQTWWILLYLGVRYFCVPIYILELCCGIQLSYMEIGLGSCFQSLLGRTGVVLHLRQVIHHSWVKDCICTLPNALCIMVFTRLLVRTDTIPGSVWLQALLPPVLFGGSFLGIRWFPHEHALICTQLNMQGRLSVDLQSSLFVQKSLQDSSLRTLAILVSLDS